MGDSGAFTPAEGDGRGCQFVFLKWRPSSRAIRIGPADLFRVQPGRFSTINTTLNDLIGFAYGLHARQVTGLPDWAGTQKYDLDGKPDGEGQPNDARWKTMIQKLMADRFLLTFHHEKKELSVYALVDQTGLEGRYDFALNWTPDETQFASLGGVPPSAGDKPDAPPDLFTAIQQQAGLKLESSKVWSM